MRTLPNIIAWILAPMTVGALSYLFAVSTADHQGDKQADSSRYSGSTTETRDTRSTPTVRWQAARKLQDPLLRAQASWQAIEAMSLEEIAAIFDQAQKDDDYELISILGDAWATRDLADFLHAVSANASGGPRTPFGKLVDASFLRYADKDSAAAFNLFQELRHQNRQLREPLMIRYLSDHPEKASEIDVSTRSLWGWEKFGGDVLALAQGLKGLAKQADRSAYLQFLGRSILTSELTDESQSKFLDWWKALPEELQREAIPWNAGPELLEQPGLHKWFAEQASEKFPNVASYMRHYGKDWAAENPREAFDWVMTRYKGRTVSGPPSLITPNTHSSEGFSISIVGPSPFQESGNYLSSVAVPIRAMARRDPQQALAALAEIPYLRTKTELYPVIAEEWAKSDPVAALEWSQTLPGKFARDKTRAHIEFTVTSKWPSGD